MKFFSLLTVLAALAPLTSYADIFSLVKGVDLSVRGGVVEHDDTDARSGAGAGIRKQFNVFGTVELNANGDIVISTKDMESDFPKAHFEGEAIFGLGGDGLMNESGVRVMKGLVVRGRYDRDLSVDLQESALYGVGYATDTDVVRTLGYRLRAVLEAGRARNSHSKYWIAQARVEGDGYVCKGLDGYGKKAVCLNLGVALNGGYLQAAAEGKVGVDYRYRLKEEQRIFLNEIRVGGYASGILTVDRDDSNVGSQALFGLEVR